MSLFILLVLISRVAYAFNDVLTGKLGRTLGGLEVACLRGVSLGFSMAPLLLLVPNEAWGRLLLHADWLLAATLLTGASNYALLKAARELPFGLRAAIQIVGFMLLSTVLGQLVLGDKLGLMQGVWCLWLLLSSVAVALGDHRSEEMTPRLWQGSLWTILSSIFIACASLCVARLARGVDPFLTAWAWEFGAGLVLLPCLGWKWRKGAGAFRWVDVGRIALASSPTVIGSGVSMAALTMGTIGLWAAMAGTQVLFVACLGVLWYGEKVGWFRWLCFASVALAVGGIALSK